MNHACANSRLKPAKAFSTILSKISWPLFVASKDYTTVRVWCLLIFLASSCKQRPFFPHPAAQNHFLQRTCLHYLLRWTSENRLVIILVILHYEKKHLVSRRFKIIDRCLIFCSAGLSLAVCCFLAERRPTSLSYSFCLFKVTVNQYLLPPTILPCLIVL